VNRYLFTLRVTVKDGERALLTRNGRFERVLEPGRHTLFDPKRELGVELHQVVRAEYAADRYAVLKAARPDLAAELFEAVETKADEIAIVSIDGRPTHLMAPWQTRVFWKVASSVEVERIDVTSEAKVKPRHLAMVARERNTLVAEHVVENQGREGDTCRHDWTQTPDLSPVIRCNPLFCPAMSGHGVTQQDSQFRYPGDKRGNTKWRSGSPHWAWRISSPGTSGAKFPTAAAACILSSNLAVAVVGACGIASPVSPAS
jgi:hypothetical protein